MKLKYRFLTIIILIAVLHACNHEYKEVIYYENGNIKELYLFKSKIDKKEKQNFKYYTYHENGNIRSTSNVKNSNLDGIDRFYTEEGELAKESFFVDGSILIQMNSVEFGKYKLCLYDYYDNGVIDNAGRLLYDSKNDIVADSSFYIKIECVDTLEKKDFQSIRIENYTDFYRNQIDSVIICEFDKEFAYTPLIEFYETDEDNLAEITFKPQDFGYNIVTGIVYYKYINDKDTVFCNLAFYDDFYVQ